MLSTTTLHAKGRRSLVLLLPPLPVVVHHVDFPPRLPAVLVRVVVEELGDGAGGGEHDLHVRVVAGPRGD